VSAEAHLGELRLRRFRLGELDSPQSSEVLRHTTSCAQCRARLKSLDDEQRAFESEVSFERFAGGVERARRVPRQRPRRLLVGASLALAAAAAAVLVLRLVPFDDGRNRIKGAEMDATLRVAAADGGNQRSLLPGGRERLQPGDRLRLGFRNDAARYLLAVSVDDDGQVTPLYPERPGGALSVPPHTELTYLPDSLELTGSGRERVFLILLERPATVDDVMVAARVAHARARGDLQALAALPLDGRGKVQQFTWLLTKP
jgi:hypothetical protein